MSELECQTGTVIQYIKGNQVTKVTKCDCKIPQCILFLLNREKCSQAAHNNNRCSYLNSHLYAKHGEDLRRLTIVFRFSSPLTFEGFKKAK